MVTYPLKVRELVANKRKARCTWQENRIFNALCKQLHSKIQEVRNESFQQYVATLSPTATTDYSLWKATKKIKRPILHVPPIRSSSGSWARSDEEKASVFADHLATVFQPNPSLQAAALQPPTTSVLDSRHITLIKPIEIARAIVQLKSKKAPGYENITAQMLKELPRKGLVSLTYIFNAALRLRYIPKMRKKAEVILVLKPGKSQYRPDSYRPISLLPIFSKLFEKLFLIRLKPILEERKLIPDKQYGFQEKHSTVEQVHRITAVISEALETKKYCAAAFIDAAQAFDRVWHAGLLLKLCHHLPTAYSSLLTSYLTDRQFRVRYLTAKSN